MSGSVKGDAVRNTDAGGGPTVDSERSVIAGGIHAGDRYDGRRDQRIRGGEVDRDVVGRPTRCGNRNRNTLIGRVNCGELITLLRRNHPGVTARPVSAGHLRSNRRPGRRAEGRITEWRL